MNETTFEVMVQKADIGGNVIPGNPVVDQHYTNFADANREYMKLLGQIHEGDVIRNL
jgi:hypothetical protein